MRADEASCYPISRFDCAEQTGDWIILSLPNVSTDRSLNSALSKILFKYVNDDYALAGHFTTANFNELNFETIVESLG